MTRMFKATCYRVYLSGDYVGRLYPSSNEIVYKGSVLPVECRSLDDLLEFLYLVESPQEETQSEFASRVEIQVESDEYDWRLE